MTWEPKNTGYLLTVAGVLLVLSGALSVGLFTETGATIRDDDGSQTGVLEAISVVAGGVAIGVGLPISWSNRLRPLTTRTAVFTSAVVFLSVIAVPALEILLRHREGFAVVFGVSLPASTLFVITGTAFRRRSAAGAILSVVVALSVVFSDFLFGSGFANSLLFILPLSVPWMVLGYVFAREGAVDRERHGRSVQPG